MKSCQEVSRLYSESLDRPLPFHQRLALWMHMKMCRFCAGFAKQLRAIRQACRRAGESPDVPGLQPDVKLPAEARDRILRSLRDQPD